MKKHFFGILLTMSVLFAFNIAYANNVSDIDIDVLVNDDGSAAVTQIWNGTFSEGTENYIPINTSDISVSDFKVSDKNGVYTTLNDWDVSADFSKKARNCGINKTSDGVELCFGISEYGSNVYTISYTVHDFIKSYSDSDGTNFMFVNPDMNTFPTNVKIKIALENGIALNEENAGIWAFGYYGQIEFRNGAVSAYTTQKLSGSEYVVTMISLEKGLISPKKSVDKSFEEVKDEAFVGSDYGYGDDTIPLWVKIVFFIILAIVILVVVFLIKRKLDLKKFYKNAPYFREVPNGGSLEVSHFLTQNFDLAKEKSLIIGASMLSMINSGALEPQTEQNVGFFGKVKTKVNLRLVKEPEGILEKRLFAILQPAAGADGVLQEKELENYSYAHPNLLEKFVDDAFSNGEKILKQNGAFSGGVGNCISDLSESGKSELAEIMGLKKYLTDFSLIAEREIKETYIWKDYLVYATLFGIADATLKQFKKIYPEMTVEIEDCNRNVIIAGSYYHTMHSSYTRALQAQRTSGAGGHASIGGGGGFSGGGHGGGSR